MWTKHIAFIVLCFVALGLLVEGLKPTRPDTSSQPASAAPPTDGLVVTLARLNRAFEAEWAQHGITPAPRASDLTLMRRLSLALVGAAPSLAEIRQFEAMPAQGRVERWVDTLLNDPRSSDYLAERFARAYVGAENGPFLIYRRRRFVTWLADELRANRPYDQLVRRLITAEGLWTDDPATNFLTVTIQPEEDGQPNESRLAARVSRAFLAQRIDCAECHDHPFEAWKQEDFQGLAAFFGQAEQSLTGIHDGNSQFTIEDAESATLRPVEPRVPYGAQMLPPVGTDRQRLAHWLTHPENKAFGRAIANRLLAIMSSRPLVAPIDDVELHDDVPETLDILAEDFVSHGYDLRRTIRLIAQSVAYQRDSRSDPAIEGHEITPLHEATWASFPLTPLRSEQIAGAIVQACSLSTIDYHSHILVKLARSGDTNEFIRRYGDAGEEEFTAASATISQRLLMMNGRLVHERTRDNIVTNAATRIAALAPSDDIAIETAYLAVLTRRPTPDEAAHFRSNVAKGKDARRRAIEDLYWSLFNSTEFALNH